MFPQTNYMKQHSTKNHLALAKAILNSCFLCKNYAIHNINISARVKNIIPSLFQSCLRKIINIEDKENN